MADAVGAGLEAVEPDDVAKVLAAFPRLGFKSGFVDLLLQEARSKSSIYPVHPVHMIAHHCCMSVAIPDAQVLIQGAPFAD
jgi:hypothetical protein